MLEFLEGPAAWQRIKDLLDQCSDARLAVAYWGKGSLEALGLTDDNKVKKRCVHVICDLFSGACNPAVMRRLLKVSGVELRTHDALHAKVYWTPTQVVVGSSNASTNGLGFEGKKATSLREANVLSDDPALIMSAEEWFDHLWSEGTLVSESMVRAAEKIWQDRQKQLAGRKGAVSSKTLLSRLRSQPDWFKGKPIKITVYDAEDASPGALDLFKREAKSRYSKVEAEEYPFYEAFEGEEGDPGDIYLDFTVGPRKGVDYNGLWQIPKNGKNIFPLNTHSHVRRQVVVLLQKLEELDGLKLSREECIELKKIVRNYLKRRKYIKLPNECYINDTLYDFWKRVS